MLITVRYTGPGEAILAGTYIQQDETRAVTPAQLQAAQEAHPAGFVIIAGDDVPEPLELEPLQPEQLQPTQLNEPADQVDQVENMNEPAAPVAPVAPRRRRQGSA